MFLNHLNFLGFFNGAISAYARRKVWLVMLLRMILELGLIARALADVPKDRIAAVLNPIDEAGSLIIALDVEAMLQQLECTGYACEE
jgi:hypothetical protein